MFVYFGKEGCYIGSPGKSFVPTIVILKNRFIESVTLGDLESELVFKMELSVAYSPLAELHRYLRGRVLQEQLTAKSLLLLSQRSPP